MKRFFLLVLLSVLFVGGDVCAQFLGTSTNYSGSRGLALNPSLMTTSYVYADFGLNLGVSAYNDFIYLNASDYFQLLRKNGTTSEYWNNGKSYDYGFFLNGKPKNIYETLDFNLISGMYSPDGKHAWGFFVNNRIYTNGTNIPYEIGEASILGIENGDFLDKNYKSTDMRFGMMAWSELGVSWSKVVYEGYFRKIDFGITAKGLIGYLGIDLNLNNVDKDIYTVESIIIHKLDIDAVLSGPIDYSAKFDGGNIFDASKIVNGLGAGFDIGFTYTFNRQYNTRPAVNRPCAAKKVSYMWRLGVSLLDVGAVHYNKNARSYKLACDTDKKFDGKQLDGAQDFDDMMDRLTAMFHDNKSETRGSDNFWMGLPTAFSVQFDYSITKKLYLNATWVQPMKLLTYSAIRPALFVVEPRYETPYFDLTIPVTFFNYEKLYVGLESRLGFLTIGTQNILNFIGVGKSYGLDLYVALKFNFYKERCTAVRGDGCWYEGF